MYLAVFLAAASSKFVSKQTVSSAKHTDLELESHYTMSGRKSVGTMWQGNWYPSLMSTDKDVVGERYDLMADAISCRTRSCRAL